MRQLGERLRQSLERWLRDPYAWDVLLHRLHVLVKGVGLAIAAVVLLVGMSYVALRYYAGDEGRYETFWRAAGVVAALSVGYALVRAAQAQNRTSEVMRFLSFAPALAAYLSDEDRTQVTVNNIGQGPALDVFPFAVRVGVTTDDEPDCVFASDPASFHLEPGKPLPVRFLPRWSRIEGKDVQPDWGPPKFDVHVFRYADLNGNHWHTWCNWTRDDAPALRAIVPFMIEPDRRTPKWIVRHCPRCQALNARLAHAGKPPMKQPSGDE